MNSPIFSQSFLRTQKFEFKYTSVTVISIIFKYIKTLNVCHITLRAWVYQKLFDKSMVKKMSSAMSSGANKEGPNTVHANIFKIEWLSSAA